MGNYSNYANLVSSLQLGIKAKLKGFHLNLTKAKRHKQVDALVGRNDLRRQEATHILRISSDLTEYAVVYHRILQK